MVHGAEGGAVHKHRHGAAVGLGAGAEDAGVVGRKGVERIRRVCETTEWHNVCLKSMRFRKTNVFQLVE